MKSLPFVQAPRPTSTKLIGTPATGIIEIEVRGGLTVAESADISEMLSAHQSFFVIGAQAADAIAKEEEISLSEAFSIIEKAVGNEELEPTANAIKIRHAKRIQEISTAFAFAGQRNMEASVTALIRHRLKMQDWSLADTKTLDRALFNGIWDLVLEEQRAEEFNAEPVNEEELGKPPQASGKRRKPTGV